MLTEVSLLMRWVSIPLRNVTSHTQQQVARWTVVHVNPCWKEQPLWYSIFVRVRPTLGGGTLKQFSI